MSLSIASDGYALLLRDGLDVVRITPDAWTALLRHVEALDDPVYPVPDENEVVVKCAECEARDAVAAPIIVTRGTVWSNL